MEPTIVNILLGINLIATFGANLGGAKKGIRTSFGSAQERPSTFLQTLPPYVSMAVLILIILSVFQVGTADYSRYSNLMPYRFIGLAVYIFFSWFQVWAYRTMGENYSQDIVILKKHRLVTSGPFKVIRHPQYLSQILADLGASVALLSYIAFIPIVLLEIPLFIMRASLEDKLLEKHFKEEFKSYKKRTGFLLPFIG